MNKLDQTLEHILKTYGHDILVIHTGAKERCSCYDAVTGSVNVYPKNPNRKVCPYCLNTGFVPDIKRYTTRYQDARIPQSNAFMEQMEGFGGISVDAKAYFFDRHAEISAKDLIMEVDWEGDKPVYTGNGVFEVAHVDPRRYIGGKINHFKVYVKSKPINIDVRAIQMVRRADEVHYQLAEKGTSTIIDPNPKHDPSKGFNIG